MVFFDRSDTRPRYYHSTSSVGGEQRNAHMTQYSELRRRLLMYLNVRQDYEARAKESDADER